MTGAVLNIFYWVAFTICVILFLYAVALNITDAMDDRRYRRRVARREGQS